MPGIYILSGGADADWKVWRVDGFADSRRHGRGRGEGGDGAGRIDPAQVEETIFGNARQAGGGPNRGAADFGAQRSPAGSSGIHREQSLRFGDEVDRAGLSVDSAWAMRTAFWRAAPSRCRGVPYYLDGARWGYRLGNQELVDGMYRDGFFCPLAKMVMGETAEVLAEQYKITREEQDEYALLSQTRAARAIAAGRFDAEIVPVTIEGKKGTTTFARDEHPFADASLEKLAKLAPVFSKTGTITAGNSSGITDGAAAVVVASEHFVKQNNLKPLARIVAVASAGVDPRTMGIGPVPALRKLEEKHNLRLHEFGLIELNEAFAAQVLACDRDAEYESRPSQRERRGDRARASDRLHRYAHHRNASARDAEAQYEARRGHTVRERRHGNGAGAGKCGLKPLTAEFAEVSQRSPRRLDLLTIPNSLDRRVRL